jgi:hypothetical protein
MRHRKVAPWRRPGKCQDNFNRIESLIERKKGDIVRSIAVVGHESRKNSWTVARTKKSDPTMLACVMTVHCAGPIMMDHSCTVAAVSQRNQRGIGGTGPSGVNWKIFVKEHHFFRRVCIGSTITVVVSLLLSVSCPSIDVIQTKDQVLSCILQRPEH